MRDQQREQSSASDEGLPRRDVLARVLWGTAGVATAGAVGALAAPSAAGAHPRRTVVYDVACLLNTFTPIVADGATNPDTDFRGTTFFVEGDLYRGATIPDGVPDFDPASVEPSGHWLCRGWFINRTARAGEADRPEPHVVTHQEYVIGRMVPGRLFPPDQLTSSGLEGTGTSEPAARSVVGGTGRYLGMTGAVVQHTIGANTTGGPNFRFEFTLGPHQH